MAGPKDKNSKKGTSSPTQAGTSDKSCTCELNMVARIEEQLGKALLSETFLSDLVGKIIEKVCCEVVSRLEKTLAFNKDEVDDLKKRIEEKEKDLDELHQRIEERTDELEQYQRRNSLRIFGVNEEKSENTCSLIVKLAKEKLGVDITEDMIDRSHRTGAVIRGSGRNRAILVKFTSYKYRSLMFHNKRS